MNEDSSNRDLNGKFQVDSAFASNLPPGFEFVKEISQTNSSYVCKAFNKSLQQFVALKILRSNSYSAQIENSILQEARLISNLRHSNLVQLLSSGTLADGTPYLAYEFVEGSDLRSLMNSGQLSRERIANIAGQIFDAVAYLHECNLLHRDLKPENIIVNDSDFVKLIDFGITRRLDIETASYQTIGTKNAVIGSPLYMSPEQCKRLELTVASDNYSLACIFYEMFTGAPPYKGNTALESIYLRTEGAPLKFPDLKVSHSFQKKFEALFGRALSFEPASRPGTKEFRRAFEELVSLYSPGVSQKPSSALLFLLAIVLLGMVSAYFLMKGAETRVPIGQLEQLPKLSSGQKRITQKPRRKLSEMTADIDKENSANGEEQLALRLQNIKNLKALAVVDKDPKEQFAIHMLLSRRVGDLKERKKELLKCLSYCPDRSGKHCYQSILVWLELGTVALESNDVDEAERYLLKAEQLNSLRFESDSNFWNYDLPEEYQCSKSNELEGLICQYMAGVDLRKKRWSSAKKRILRLDELWPLQDNPLEFESGHLALAEILYHEHKTKELETYLNDWEAGILNYQDSGTAFKRLGRMKAILEYLQEWVSTRGPLPQQKKRLAELIKKVDGKLSVLLRSSNAVGAPRQ